MSLGTEAITLIWLFILGAIVGSFVNVCIHRLPRGESIVSPRSRCPRCGHQIAALDNIPIVSYLVLNGRCRHCGGEISIRYPIVELLTALLLSVVGFMLMRRGEPVSVIIVYLVLMVGFVIVSFIDWERREIPDQITIPGMVLGPLVSVVFPALHFFPAVGRAGFHIFSDLRIDSLVNSALGLLVGAGLTYATGVLGRLAFRKEAMGFGDVKYMGMIGGVLGVKLTVMTFLIAPFLGLAVGVERVIRKRDHHIPYGPFLSIAAVITMLWGTSIFNWLVSGKLLQVVMFGAPAACLLVSRRNG